MKLKKIKKTLNLAGNIFKYGFNSFYRSFGINFQENRKIPAFKAIRNMFEGDNQIIQAFEESLFKAEYSYPPHSYITEEEIFERYGLRRKAWQYDLLLSQYDPLDETNEATIVMHGDPSYIPTKVKEEDFLIKEINELSMKDLLPRLTRNYILIQARYGETGFGKVMKLFTKLKLKGLFN